DHVVAIGKLVGELESPNGIARSVRRADPYELPAALLDHDLAARCLHGHVRELAARLLDGAVLLARGVVEAAGAGLLAQPVDRVQPQPPHLAALAQAQARGRAVDVVVEQIAGQLAGARAGVGVLAPAEPARRIVPSWV